MTAPARLTGLRVLGFKSFAERTTVEFGPGISAVIGPNGSGKSNLADALRWTLGEAGRSLRTRRAEDVIFAGSSERKATGMADVTLLLDNADRLLPVDYGQVELGRRLFRSGENEYLLNRQRIRLRDLIDLLDAGNLADNAFLFIGQGMVDQALALRPEERRPLFEEAAGVRRHERRRRQAETGLAEAEANLERLRDVLAELRPQARRLAAQAEQLLARRSAGHDLAEALVASARARWHELSAVARADQAALDDAHREADIALADLRAAEEVGQRLARGLAERADKEGAARARLDELRAAGVELRLAVARVASELGGAQRDRERIEAERASLAERSAAAERVLAAPVPSVESQLELELAEVEAEIASARAATGASSAPPATDLGALDRRRIALAGQIDELHDQLERDEAAVADADEARQSAIDAATAARASFEEAETAAHAAWADLERLLAEEARLARESSTADASVAGLRSRQESVDRALDAAAHAVLGRAVRARGGTLAAEGLEADPAFRHAIAAALGDAAQGWLVSADAVAALPRDGGTLLIRQPQSRVAAGGSSSAARQVELAASLGGGALVDAIRRDPQGELTRLLAHTLWVPRLEDALHIRGQLAPGWQVVTVEGQVLTQSGLLRLAGSDRFLAMREERAEIAAQLPAAATAHAGLAEALRDARAEKATLADRSGHARATLDESRRAAQVADEVVRTTQRRADTVGRDQALRRSRLAGMEAEATDIATRIEAISSQRTSQAPRAAPRLAQLTGRRDVLAGRLATQRQTERAATEARQRAEVALAMADDRSRQLDDEAEILAGRLAELAADRERATAQQAAAVEAERAAAEELQRLVGDAGTERRQLIAAEAKQGQAREQLRAAEARSRTAEVAAMEDVVRLDAQREQLLVELAGIGADAIPVLAGAIDGSAIANSAISADAPADQLAAVLDAAIERWHGQAAVRTDVPSPAKLAALRRRFHELGAGNPFAATEYAEARDRLEQMEAQARDLESAISATRQLIADLNALIASQFRSTFAALEDAFGRRFKQLFDGGDAELALTAPDDLAATGIEIAARPPGKKRQPLQMLSGGERSLTAVALLLAMLEVRPVPFCVLDEVDAALDEANISRFAQALRGLADRTQFIVITHNRGTIEMADALYGVTIGPDAVSHVVSLRLPPITPPTDTAGNGHGTAEVAAEVMA